jgi:IS30 family transposase
MPAKPLTAPEREEIRVGICSAETNAEIARRLGRHRATIGREIARNGGRDAYSATTAQARADAQRARPKQAKLAADEALAVHVTARLKAKDSPMTISIELARGTHGLTADISHECIYQAIYAHGTRGLAKGLHTGLHRQRRCRKHRRAPGEALPAKASPLGEFNLITARPPIADRRSEVGHLEGDLIIGSFNRSAIATVFDRASRHLWLADFPASHDAEETLAAVGEILGRIPEALRRTLTWDQGREMASHHELADLYGIDVYFAEPHSPWQRPTNENGNGLIRRWFPKSTNLAAHDPDTLRLVEHRINTIPRRSLNWDTAHDRYHAAVAMTG